MPETATEALFIVAPSATGRDGRRQAAPSRDRSRIVAAAGRALRPWHFSSGTF